VLQIGGPDESPIANKEALLRALVQTQSLPKTFGFNWDALVDSLSNLEQPNATGYALILRQPSPLQTQSPEDYETFIEVLEEVSARWARSGVPFKLLVPRQA
jgi:RNAse (barnase) inhibitor barstar